VTIRLWVDLWVRLKLWEGLLNRGVWPPAELVRESLSPAWIVLIWYTSIETQFSFGFRFGHTVRRRALSLPRKRSAYSDASPMTNTLRKVTIFAFELFAVNYIGSCPRQLSRHV